MQSRIPSKGLEKAAVGPTDASASCVGGASRLQAPGGPHRRRRGGIRTRFLWLLAVTFVPILLLLSWIYYERYQTRRDMELEANLEIAHAVGLAFEGFVAGVSRQELAIGNALVALTPFSTAQANHLLTTSAAGYPAVEGFHWVSPQGRVLVSSNPRRGGADMSADPYFRPVRAGETWVADLSRTPETGEWRFAIRRGIAGPRGGLAGIMVARVVPQRLGEAGIGLRRPQQGGVSLVDRNGLCVFRYAPPAPYSIGADWGKQYPVIRQAMEGRESMRIEGDPSMRGQWRMIAGTPIRGIGWVASAGRPEKVAMAPIWEGLLRDLVLFGLVDALALLAALYISAGITAPIRRLEAAAECLGAGDLGDRAASAGPLEVARLAAAFNGMVERLQERTKEVQGANEQLQAQSEELTRANEELQSQQEELGQAWEETKRAEEELRRSQALLAGAERLSHTGAWEWDLAGNRWTFSEEWLAIHGCSKGTLSLEELLPIAHPDDRAEIERAFEDARTGIRPYSLEHRIIRQDTGEVRIVNAYGQLVRDAHGTTMKVLGVTQDITDRKQAELERETTVEFLRLANESTATRDLIEAAAGYFQRQSGCEAVGVRLQEGDDYPYYEAMGFPNEFVLAESSLCARGDAGGISRDSVGNPVLECMCGNVICRRFDPSKPFFTPAGSFWTNSTTELLSSTTEADRQARTRNRCNGEGYESVALIPLRCKEGRCLGLLQLNDRRKGRFTPGMIALWERLAGYLAVALAKSRAEDALQEASQRLQSHVENSPLAVIEFDPKYRVIRWSGEAQRIFGWSAEEVLGKRVVELPWVYEEDVEKVATLSTDMYAGRRRRNFHVNRNYRKNGSVIECEWYNSALLDPSGKMVSVLSQVLDTTERKRAEERAAALQEITAALSRALTPEEVADVIARQGMRALGADLGFMAALSENGREVEMVRSSTHYPQEVLASSWPIPVEAPTPLAEAVREGRLVTVGSEEEWSARYPDWDLKRARGYTAGVAAPMVVDSRVVGAIVVRFAGPRQFREEELRLIEAIAGQASQALERARLFEMERRAQHELREADRRKDEFLAMLSHELRNPLAAIAGAVDVLRLRGGGDAIVQRAGDIADRQVGHMKRLLDDLLDVARITQGTIELRKEEVDLAGIVETAVQTARPAIEAKGHILSVSLPSGSDRMDDKIVVEADPVRLGQVIANLLDNAAKYTPPGGQIWVSAEVPPLGAQAVVRVRDNGMGIPADLLPRIFDLFVQGERSLARSEGGLGIGLTMVRRLVEMHGGSVEAHSDGPGQGSELIVRLPVQASGVPVQGSGGATMNPKPRTPNPAKRILVVDDNADAAKMLAMLLGVEGHEVVEAHSGPAALDIAGSYRPDVVLLDLGMPGMDGYEVARRLRCLPGLADTPLIALTGYGQEEDRERSREAGFDHYLTKPVDFEGLKRLLVRLG